MSKARFDSLPLSCCTSLRNGEQLTLANGQKIPVCGTSKVKISTTHSKHRVFMYVLEETSHPRYRVFDVQRYYFRFPQTLLPVVLIPSETRML